VRQPWPQHVGYQKTTRYYLSSQTQWGRQHGIRRVRVRAEELERLVVAAVAALFADRDRVRAMLLRLGIVDHSLNKLAAPGQMIASIFDDLTFNQIRSILRSLIIRVELGSSLLKS